MDPVLFIYSFLQKGGRAITDSREVGPHDVFFALRGDNFDGNRFALDAISKGTSLVVIDDPAFAVEGTLLVSNVLESLQRVANHHRRVLGIPILGITGSNGKTTTKELLSKVLQKKFKVSFTQGNLNNHIGVPLTILSFSTTTEFGIVEMGANHLHEIAQLCSITEPNFGIVTNVGKAHLDGFGSFEGVKKGKGELYDYLAKNKGLAFYNQSNAYLSEMIASRTVDSISYSASLFGAELYPTTSKEPFLRTSLPSVGVVSTHLFGKYNLENVLASFAVGRKFGVPDLLIKEAIEEYVPGNSRSQIVKTENNTVLLDCYNANPTSMRSALMDVSEIDNGKKIAILGDMLELGSFSEEEHTAILNQAMDCGFEKIFLVGPLFSKVAKDYPVSSFPDSACLLEHFANNPVLNSFVLLKGSRGIRLEKVFDSL
ncbi:UDP-N-acetylmuramoyl-tripeptide--D-alanyl-D-alanine ligase [Williamwhitmania taraxaci]|uniref:UDP-N-acetylmuramoyl-tripeptide--D-alanyl-D-alanine ligase n=1 Tax=Williamwhitmania taraxaci TaxID=1640674 RepID=A0A1G6GR88_9BACT|nr:UDP-N-acetylmuramoyl-tripeptide--D-alanyl-D-alanine ligase [Williamwhitmania taraxaci]SDB84537.1 UDP-N-acetylmuramoyl-tripeptide--D-alanyl-D-alanine ligase [Williamwhitmania taraxaci]